MSNEVQELELSIKEAQKMVDLGKSLDRLMKNRDFKRVIQDEYLEAEAIRLVHLKADANVQDERTQQRINTRIEAIGNFKQFLQFITYQAEQAQDAVEACEEALDEARAEDDE